MEQWRSPRHELEEERKRQFALFDSLAELVDAGTITIDDLKTALTKPINQVWTPEEAE